MTTDEKIAMLGLSANSALSISNETPAIARLCLPSLVLRDGPLGVGAGAQNTTAFPAQINLASSFDVALAQQYGAALGQEARLQGNMGIQGPGLDVAPFDNWGRLFENFGEDPLLTSSMGTAEVSGIQGQGTIAIAKHYGPYAAEDTRPVTNYTASNATLQQVYLAPFRAAIQSGLSGLMCSYGATDTTPNCANPFLMGEAAHWGFTGIARTDAGALKNDVAAVRDGVGLFKTLIAGQIPAALADGLLTIAQLNAAVATTLQVMFQYHDIPAPSGTSATPASTPQSLAVATRIAEEGSVLLKNDGTLPLSSTNASLGVIATTPSSNPLAQGLGSSFVVGTGTVTPLAGLQSAFGPSNVSYDAALPTFLPVSTGPATLINPRLRIYSAPVMIPLDTHGVVDFNVQTPSSAQLLRNGRTFFQTLRQTTNVGGDFAARAVRVGAGDSLTVQWVGTAPVLTYAPVNDVIAQAVAMARRVKVPIVMVGTRATEGNDMSSLALPGFQNQLVAAVAAANPRTVVVVNAGNPVLMPWLSKVAAVLDNWYPGQVDGAALSDLLDGVADPSGKLPIAFPTSDLWAPLIPSTWPYAVSAINLDKLGVNVGEHWYDVRHITPLFAFGFGLSYTSFALSNLSAVATTGGYNLTVQVSNTGPVSGRAVTEVYVSGPPGSNLATNTLGTFTSTTLDTGASTSATMFLPASAMAQWSNNSMRVLQGTYTLNVGQSSTGPFLSTPVTVASSFTTP